MPLCSPHAKIKNKKKIKEELESDTIQFFTETIKNAVADDGKRTPKRNRKKNFQKGIVAQPVQLISKTKENNHKDGNHDKDDDDQNREEEHCSTKNSHDNDNGSHEGDNDGLSDDIM